MKILLGNFSVKVGIEDIFKSAIGNEGWHKLSKDNEVRVVNFITSKILSKVQCSHILIFLETRRQIDYILINTRRNSSVLAV
jgi:hypothetical protein